MKTTDLFRKLTRIVDPSQKKKFYWLIPIILLGSCLEAFGVSLMVPLITVIMDPGVMLREGIIHTVCSALDITEHRIFVLLCIGCIILCYILKNAFLIFQTRYKEEFAATCKLITRGKAMHSFLSQPYEYHLYSESGDLVKLIKTDIPLAYNALSVFLGLITDLVVMAAVILSIGIIDPLITGVSCFVLIATSFVILRFLKPMMREAGKNYHLSSREENKWILETVGGIKEIIVTGKQGFFEEKIHNCGKISVESGKKNTLLSVIPRMLLEVISVCSILLLIGIAVYNGREITSLIPSLGALTMAAVRLLPGAYKVIGAWNTLLYALPSIDRVTEALDATPSETPFSASFPVPFPFRDHIELRNISYRYPGTTEYILKDANMVIPFGMSVGIVGMSGAGKTTAADIVLGLLKPEQGEVLCDGRNILENYPGWISCIGYIPQMIFLLDDSIRKNIAFGTDEDQIDEARLSRALREAQLESFVNTLSEKADTRIGERGIRLSGGQRQRIGIARALYNDPEILVFDEATSSLDTETESALMDAIEQLHGKKTMIIIAHRLNTIRKCDLVYRVRDSRIEQSHENFSEA